MIVIAPARADDRITLRGDSLGEVIKAIGTNGYGRSLEFPARMSWLRW